MFLESPLTNSFRSQLRLEEYKEEESTRLQVKCVLSVILSPKHSSLKICDKAKEKKMFVRSRKIIFKSNTVRSFFTTKGSKSGKSFFRLYSRTTKFGVNKKWMLPITVAGGILAANYIISNKESKSEELKVSYGQHNVTYSQGPQNAQHNAPQSIVKQVLTQEIKFLSQNNFFDNSQKKTNHKKVPIRRTWFETWSVHDRLSTLLWNSISNSWLRWRTFQVGRR